MAKNTRDNKFQATPSCDVNAVYIKFYSEFSYKNIQIRYLKSKYCNLPPKEMILSKIIIISKNDVF